MKFFPLFPVMEHVKNAFMLALKLLRFTSCVDQVPVNLIFLQFLPLLRGSIKHHHVLFCVLGYRFYRKSMNIVPVVWIIFDAVFIVSKVNKDCDAWTCHDFVKRWLQLMY